MEPWEIDWGKQTRPDARDKEPWEMDWGNSSGQEAPVGEYVAEQNKGLGGDVWTGLKSGLEQVPGVVTGLADIPTALAFGARPFTRGAEAAGRFTGFEPGKWSEEAQKEYSPQMQQSIQEVGQAWDDPNASLLEKTGAVMAHPRYMTKLVAENLPQMFVGGIGGRALMTAGRVVAPTTELLVGGTGARAVGSGYLERAVGEKLASPIAAGASEGLTQTGQSMEQGKELSDQRKIAISAIGSGATDALIAMGAGRVAQKIGLETLETKMAKGFDNQVRADLSAIERAGGALGKRVGMEGTGRTMARMGAGGISEGILQELPQSAQEQVWQNWAENKPLWQGVDRQAIEGMLVGAAMGAGANMRSNVRSNVSKTELLPNTESQEQDQEQEAPPPAGGLTPALNAGQAEQTQAPEVPLETAPPATEGGLTRPSPEQLAAEEAKKQEEVRAVEEEKQTRAATLDHYGADTVTSPDGTPIGTKFGGKIYNHTGDPESNPQLVAAINKTIAADLAVHTTSPELHGVREKVLTAAKESGFISAGAATPAKVDSLVKELNLTAETPPATAVQFIESQLATLEGKKTETAQVKRDYFNSLLKRFGGKPKEAQNAVQIGSTKKEVPSLAPAGETVTESGEGVGRGEQGAQTTAESKAKEVAPQLPTDSTQLPEFETNAHAYLTKGMDPVEMALYESTRSTASKGKTSLRALAKSFGVSHTEVATRAKRTEFKIRARAKAMGISMTDAERILGIEQETAADTAVGVAAFEGGRRSSAQAENDDFVETHGFSRDEDSVDAATAEKVAAGMTEEQAHEDVMAEIDKAATLLDTQVYDAAESALTVYDPATVDGVANEWGEGFSELPTWRQLHIVRSVVKLGDTATSVEDFVEGMSKILGEKNGPRTGVTSETVSTNKNMAERAPAESADSGAAIPEASVTVGNKGIGTTKVTAKKRRVVEKPETKFSEALNAELSSWKSAIADWFAGTLARTEAPRMLGSTPAVLQVIGLKDLPMLVRGEHFIEDSLYNHNIKQSQLVEAVKDLADPVAIFADKRGSEYGVVIVTRQTNNEGHVVIALHPEVHAGGASPVHMGATIRGESARKLAARAVSGDLVYQGDLSNMPQEVLQGITEGKKEFGQTAIDLSALKAGKLNDLPRTARVQYRADAVKLIESGAAKYSEGTIKTPISKDVLTSRLKRMFRAAPLFDKIITIYATQEEANAEGVLSDAKGRVQGFKTTDGKIGLIAENIEDGQELGVFLHEVGVHLGMEKLIGKNNMKWLDGRIQEWAKKDDGSPESVAAKAAIARSKESTTDDNAEGRIAYMVEELVKSGVQPKALVGKAEGWLYRLVGAMRTALLRLNLKWLGYSGQNLVDLAFGAANIELGNTGKPAQVSPERQGDLRLSESYADEDTTSVQAALKDAKTVGDAIDILLASTPSDTFEHKVLSALSRHEGVRSAALELAGEVDINTDVVSSTLGRFFTESNRVEMYDGAGTKTFIHEAVHAALFREYKTNPAFRDAVERLFKIAYRRASLSERAEYGMKNAQEFLSEAYSNPEFQAVLGGMGQGDTTVLARFISAIKQFFAKLLGKYARGTESVLQELVYETFGQLGTESETAAFLRTELGKDIAKRKELTLERVVGSSTVAPDSPSKGVWEKAGAAFDRFFNDPMTMVKEHGLGWLSMDHLVEVAQGVNDKLSEYRDVSRKMQALSKEWVYKAAKIDSEWGKLSNPEAKQLSSVMRAATRAGFDPETSAVPDTAAEHKIVAVYAKLSPAAVKVYKAARDHYASARKERQEIAGGVLTAAHKNLIESAEASGDAVKIKKAKDKLKSQLEKLDTKYKEVKGPYFPLMRLGKWYVVGMSKELAALEEIDNPSDTEKTRISALRKIERHYTTSSYETKSQAQAAQKALSKKYGATRLNRAEEKSHAAGVLSAAGLQDVEDYINSSFDKEVASEIRTMMAELYYKSLPEHHALKHEMKREGVHGEEQDMRRVFAVSTIKSAHYMSRLKHADDLKSALFAIRREGKKGSDAMEYYNEVVKRAKLSMDETSAPWADKVAAVSYLAHLGLNPAFVLTNASQVAMITAPWLAARTSTVKATAALGSAYRVAGDLIVSSYEKQGWRAELDWEGKVPKGVSDMLTTLLKRNLLDITIEHDLGATAELKNRVLGDALKIGNLPVHITELANRTVTAIAAYNLAITELKMSQAEAEEFASKAVSSTQLDYSALNAPRHMQRVFGSAPAARIVMQFRKYQQGMLWLIGRSIYSSMKGASPKERAEARKTLLGLFTTTGIMAGSLGMPLAGTAMWGLTALAAIGGDDDEPWDARVEYQNWLAEMVGKDAAVAITKGVPAWMFGIDLEKRLGMGDIASPLPFMRQGKTAQEDAANALLAAAGAPVGTMVDIWDGVGMMGQGDWVKGAEKVIPLKGVQNLVRGARYGVEGMTERDGYTILPSDSFSLADIGAKMVGFATTKESTYYEATSAVKSAQLAATDTRKKLLGKYAQARIAGEDTTDIVDKMKSFNSRHPEKDLRIDGSSRVKAVQTRRLALRQRGESGLLKNKQAKPFLGEASFAE